MKKNRTKYPAEQERLNVVVRKKGKRSGEQGRFYCWDRIMIHCSLEKTGFFLL